MIYKSDNVTIYGNRTAKGIEYLEYGKPGDPLIIYLHGIGEVGKTPYSLLLQSPVCAGWNSKLGQWGEMEGFKYPAFFTKGIRVVAPVLKSGSWTPAYINSFLDEINNTNLTCLMGWSWGGAGVGVYLNQVSPKYIFKCGVLLSMAGAGTGNNVKCPVKIVHAVNDGPPGTSVSNSDAFWSGVPQQFKSEYEKPSGGGHYVWTSFLEPSTGIYEWIKSFSEPGSPLEDIESPSLKLNPLTGELIINNTHKIQTFKL